MDEAGRVQDELNGCGWWVDTFWDVLGCLGANGRVFLGMAVGRKAEASGAVPVYAWGYSLIIIIACREKMIDVVLGISCG